MEKVNKRSHSDNEKCEIPAPTPYRQSRTSDKRENIIIETDKVLGNHITKEMLKNHMKPEKIVSQNKKSKKILDKNPEVQYYKFLEEINSQNILTDGYNIQFSSSLYDFLTEVQEGNFQISYEIDKERLEIFHTAQSQRTPGPNSLKINTQPNDLELSDACLDLENLEKIFGEII